MFEGRFPLIVTSPSAPWRTPIRIYQPMNALETASKTRRFLSLLWNDGVKNYGETSSAIWKLRYLTLLSGFNFQPLWKIGKLGWLFPTYGTITNVWNILKPPIRTCFNDRRSWSNAEKSQEKSTVGSVDWDHPSHRVEHGFRWNDIIQDIVIIRFIVIYLFTRQNTDSSYHSFKFRIHDAIDVLSIVIM